MDIRTLHVSTCIQILCKRTVSSPIVIEASCRRAVKYWRLSLDRVIVHIAVLGMASATLSATFSHSSTQVRRLSSILNDVSQNQTPKTNSPGTRNYTGLSVHVDAIAPEL